MKEAKSSRRPPSSSCVFFVAALTRFAFLARSTASLRLELFTADASLRSVHTCEPTSVPRLLLVSETHPILNMTEHDAEEFRVAFEGQPYRAEADEIRMNDPARTGLYLGQIRRVLSDDAARLLGRYIATNDHLKALYLFSNVVVDSFFDELRGSRSLIHIDIGIRLSEQSVQSILPFLMNAPKLKGLRLNLESASLRPIVRALNGRNIEKLSLADGDIGDISAIGSCNLPHLECLVLARSGITSVPPLHGFPGLTRLSLYGNKIDNDGFARLNEYLASDSCQLDSLDLSETGMADEDISLITRALKHNRSLTKLRLSDNDCGETGYRSILKMVVDISSIKATLESNTFLYEIVLPKENDTRDESDSDADSDASEYHSRDGFEEIRNWIDTALNWNGFKKSPRERVIETHLDTRARRQLCEMQGVDYSYGSLFVEIPPCVLPELFATLWEHPEKMDPLRALVATVSSLTSLVDRRLMVETALERNRALIKQLNEMFK